MKSKQRELGRSEGQRVRLLNMSEKERVRVQRGGLDRKRTHLSGKLQGNRQRRASRGTNGLVHTTAQFGTTKDPRAGPSAHCLGFKWPHQCGEMKASRCALHQQRPRLVCMCGSAAQRAALWESLPVSCHRYSRCGIDPSFGFQSFKDCRLNIHFYDTELSPGAC